MGHGWGCAVISNALTVQTPLWSQAVFLWWSDHRGQRGVQCLLTSCLRYSMKEMLQFSSRLPKLLTCELYNQCLHVLQKSKFSFLPVSSLHKPLFVLDSLLKPQIILICKPEFPVFPLTDVANRFKCWSEQTNYRRCYLCLCLVAERQEMMNSSAQRKWVPFNPLTVQTSASKWTCHTAAPWEQMLKYNAH